MKVAILGTRGIPNSYGGFEQLAEKLSAALVKRGCSVWVYCPHNQHVKENSWNGVNLIHKHNPEQWMKEAGQFVYDLLCISDSRSRNFDLILHLGYTSSSVWFKLHSKNHVIITNMDGMEWKRSKYGRASRMFLRYAEKLAIKKSNVFIADSKAIANYLEEKYKRMPVFIPYGAAEFQNPDSSYISGMQLDAREYFLNVGRLQKDNNTETIIKGWILSGSDKKLVITGNTNNAYGKYLRKKYKGIERLIFSEGIYDSLILNNLRYFADIIFHGHSCGGTNPALLEAMACKNLISAHNNEFNREVLGENALYFNNPEEIAYHIKNIPEDTRVKSMISNNLEKIKLFYSDDIIAESYYKLFADSIK